MKKSGLFFIIMLLASQVACSGNPSDNQAATKNSALAESSSGKVVTLNQDIFRQLVWDYKKNSSAWVFEGDMPVIVDFYADWCRPCRALAPTMEALATEYKGKVRFYKINTDQNRELSGLMGISSIPALLFIPRPGNPKFSLGALPKDQLQKMIQDFLLKNQK